MPRGDGDGAAQDSYVCRLAREWLQTAPSATPPTAMPHPLLVPASGYGTPEDGQLSDASATATAAAELAAAAPAVVVATRAPPASPPPRGRLSPSAETAQHRLLVGEGTAQSAAGLAA